MSSKGWIGVDLDGTLAEYHGWDGGAIGDPIPAMVARVKGWLDRGIEVRVVTARMAAPSKSERARAQSTVQIWCLEHLGAPLPVTCSKDFDMMALWDDRAVQVIPNTGIPVTATGLLG